MILNLSSMYFATLLGSYCLGKIKQMLIKINLKDFIQFLRVNTIFGKTILFNCLFHSKGSNKRSKIYPSMNPLIMTTLLIPSKVNVTWKLEQVEARESYKLNDLGRVFKRKTQIVLSFNPPRKGINKMILKDLLMNRLRDLTWHIETLRFRHCRMLTKCLNLKSQKEKTIQQFYNSIQFWKKQNLSLSKEWDLLKSTKQAQTLIFLYWVSINYYVWFTLFPLHFDLY